MKSATRMTIHLPSTLAAPGTRKSGAALAAVEAQLRAVAGPCIWLAEEVGALRAVLDLLDDQSPQTQDFLSGFVSLAVLGEASSSFCMNALRMFNEVVVLPPKQSLPLDALLAVLRLPDASARVISCVTDPVTRTVVLVRGDLSTIAIPFDSFIDTHGKATPDLGKMRADMQGKAVTLGKNAAAVADLLEAFDPSYEAPAKPKAAAAKKAKAASAKKPKAAAAMTAKAGRR